MLPVLSLLVVGSCILGATTLEDFALALLVGLITGAYSSIFVATPLLAMLKEREPRYTALQAERQHRGARDASAAATAVAARGSAAVADPHGIATGVATPARPAATAAGGRAVDRRGARPSAAAAQEEAALSARLNRERR